MKMTSMVYLATLGVALAGSPDGVWNSFGITAPQYLDFDDQYTMLGGYDFEVFGPESLTIVGGTFDGGASSMQFLDGGAVRVSSAGDPVEYLWRNANEDVIVGAKRRYDAAGVSSASNGKTQTFSIVLKQPSALATSDLLGQWQAVRIQVPDRMTYEYDDDIQVSVLAGHQNFDLESFEINFRTTGPDQYVATHSTEGDLGSFAAVGNDTITTGFGVTLKINASKNVMVATESDSSSNPDDANRILLIFVKKATTSATLTSLAGRWPTAYFDFPRAVEAYQDEAFDPIGHDDFDAGGERLLLSPFGVFREPGKAGVTRVNLGLAGGFTATGVGQPTSYGYYTDDQQVALTWQRTNAPGAGIFGFSMLVRYERPFLLAKDPDDPTKLALTVPFDGSGTRLMRSTDMKTWTKVTVSDNGAHVENFAAGAYYRLEPVDE